ncbi:hypothetical protein HYPSUDRAFT_137499 [Hypholoma sublateritium FD-334 SS-4]|uniref:Afadin and alpha-actinin-binding-domain-containing protein n=1 Tax=Hypholoma sublateritium (strain FD-334 SS-4) TaxID=945553 RepID=A0A0D2PVA8_HYPSF|nr:hypothetical protein HYPSUDRAFT_137499 [Hypholoma sublateritium FD-334 SS-4]
MNPATPTLKKLVHWDTNSPSLSNIGSPFLNGTYDSSVDATSSFDFINSQLMAHGYIASPGLSLAGISNENSVRLAKCLLAMLSQRTDDMSRTEDLTTKLRTLSYDHERLTSMYRTSNEKAANAERETNLHKSRQAASLKNLQVSEAAHKQTSTELQRTRALLQGVRATHVAELKKKEKEVERTLEKWQKLADAQNRISAAQTGLRYANASIIEGTEIVGKGQGFLDIALEQAEQARAHLGDENLLLRKLLLRVVNEMQIILHQAKRIAVGDDIVEEPMPMTLSTLFPLSPPDMASDRLRSVLEDLRNAVSELVRPTPPAPAPPMPKPQVSEEEVERLQTIISSLKEELVRSQKQSIAHVADTQAMFDKFAEDHRIATSEIGDMSVELMSAPLKDEEKERLDKLRNELDLERQKFTDAAIRFGKEKATLEAERMKFLDEKRAWQVELMLAEFPPTPVPASPNRPSTSAFTLQPQKSPYKSPRRTTHKVAPNSPRRSPAKNICVGKASSSGRKAHRVSRRSLAASPNKLVVSYETEYMPPPIPAPSFTFTSAAPLLVPSISGSLLPTSFVLPPPSPRASLPTNPALPLQPSHPSSPPSSPELQGTTPTYSPDTSPPPAPSAGSINLVTPPAAKRPFPVAKPFALRMMHAYSPVKPSPLSRILMLADSPLTPASGPTPDTVLSPTSGPLEAVAEEDEEDGGLAYIATALDYKASHPTRDTRMSATELGMESPPDTPLQEKKVASVNVAPPPVFAMRGKVFHPEPGAGAKRPLSAADKGKGRATEPVAWGRSSGVGEKENSSAKRRSAKASPSNAAPVVRKAVSTTGKPVFRAPAPTATSNVTSRSRPVVKPGPPVAGGARRVLVTSADAPPIVKGRRG